jgi:hypothetical protein
MAWASFTARAEALIIDYKPIDEKTINPAGFLNTCRALSEVMFYMNLRFSLFL